MTQRKSEAAARTNEREAPHVVELAHPPDRLAVVDAMYGFHHERGIAIRPGRRQRCGEQEFVRFCFLDATTADAFRESFGGERLDATNGSRGTTRMAAGMRFRLAAKKRR